MSVPDHELDEPDPLWCEEHDRARPCRECWREHAEARADSREDR